jgi:hypothetical protein
MNYLDLSVSGFVMTVEMPARNFEYQLLPFIYIGFFQCFILQGNSTEVT